MTSMISSGLAIREGLSANGYYKPGSVKVSFKGRTCLVNQSLLIRKASTLMATTSEELLTFLTLTRGDRFIKLVVVPLLLGSKASF